MNAKLTPRTCLLMLAAIAALGTSAALAKEDAIRDCRPTGHLLETGENLFNCGFRDDRGATRGAEGPIRTLEGGMMKSEPMAPSRPWVNDYVRNAYEQNALGGGE